jgi:hypothetical protein
VAALASVTLGLVVVSYDAPKTLASTLESYRAGGLLDLLEDRVCVLSAALPEEIALCLALGFRVYTPARAETRAAVARHHDTVFARFEAADVEAFPHTHLKDGRPATYVGPAALLGYLDMTVDVVIFAEKDWFLSPLVSPRLLARSLLASLAMLSGNTQVVRLRRGDDTNRDGIVNVCAGEGADGNSNFHGGGCSWNTRYVSAMRPRRGNRARARARERACACARVRSRALARNALLLVRHISVAPVLPPLSPTRLASSPRPFRPPRYPRLRPREGLDAALLRPERGACEQRPAARLP